jgi:hypothetical protein
MPLKSWRINLGEFQIVVTRHTEKGVLVDFLVALLAWTGSKWECITRYDCAHGFAHRDVIGERGGVLYKQPFPGLSYAQVFDYALLDFQKSYEAHLQFFRAN